MRNNNTQFRKFDAGRPKSNAIKTNRKRFSSNLSNDYKIALQLYCINKEQAIIKKDLKYEKSVSVTSAKFVSKTLYPTISTLVSFLTVTFSFSKKVRQDVALIAE